MTTVLRTQIRAVLLAVTALLVTLGLLPEAARPLIEGYADAVIGAILFAWSAVALRRAGQQRTGTEP